MELKVKRDELTKTISFFDLTFAALETKDAFLLVDMIKHARSDHRKYLLNEFFLNASSSLKNEMESVPNWTLKIEDVKFDLNGETKHTFGFNKRAHEKGEPVSLQLADNTFGSLEKEILQTGDVNLILSFAKNFHVNDKIFLEKLTSMSGIYEKAYRRDVMNDYRYQKDELQLYV